MPVEEIQQEEVCKCIACHQPFKDWVSLQNSDYMFDDFYICNNKECPRYGLLSVVYE